MMGMDSAEWFASTPKLTLENKQVIDVWMFCGGWNPAILPLAVTYHDVQDVDFLIAQLIAMRDAIQAHYDAISETSNVR